MCLDPRRDVGVLGAPPQLVERRLVAVDGVDRDAERRGQDERLPTCDAARINDQVEMVFRQAAQGLQRVGVAAGPELAHAPEKKLKGIESNHASPRSVFHHHPSDPNHRDRIVLGK
ncbi:hypothetical protein [Sinorhizobium fredii]|uniref:hypothetical protein n=1 Tax=Rhizobium fredii TaxID=380 RepID=UPI000AC1DAA1|nr:hypothetical protein [Sinorhizobium fredii]WOS66882.1 hypothetical protein SFGR64A_22570 [Sinorhizobium fredii GR64]